jgi:hypothetical protein
MKPKYLFTFLAAIVLTTTTTAFGQQSSTPPAADAQEEPLSQAFTFADGSDYLSVYAEDISAKTWAEITESACGVGAGFSGCPAEKQVSGRMT